jgi:hypothetical protein
VASDLPLGELLLAIQECWCDLLAESLGGAPADCCLIVGEPSVPECCGGYAWVRLVNAYPSVEFPSLDTEPRRCPLNLWAAVVEIGITRCAPKACDQLGNVCCESELEATLVMLDDFRLLRSLLGCCVPIPSDGIIPGTWNVQGPEGGCLVTSMLATFRFEEDAQVVPES